MFFKRYFYGETLRCEADSTTGWRKKSVDRRITASGFHWNGQWPISWCWTTRRSIVRCHRHKYVAMKPILLESVDTWSHVNSFHGNIIRRVGLPATEDAGIHIFRHTSCIVCRLDGVVYCCICIYNYKLIPVLEISF